ncbi:MAG: CvpA family protein [Anaerolineae bacterium]
MNWVDVLIAMALIGGMTIGLFQGTLRQLIGLVLLYFAIVLAAAYYQAVGAWIRSWVWLNTQSAEALAFAFILGAGFGVLSFITRDYHKARLPILKHLDQVGGLVLGFATSCVWISLVVAVLAFATQAPWTWHQPGKPVLAAVQADSIRLAVHRALVSSPLANVFARLLPYIVFSVKPWAPTEILRILSIR